MTFAIRRLALLFLLCLLASPALAQYQSLINSVAAAVPQRQKSTEQRPPVAERVSVTVLDGFAAEAHSVLGTLDGVPVALQSNDGSHLPAPISGMGAKIESVGETFRFPDGNSISFKFSLARSLAEQGGVSAWFHVEVPPTPPSTVPGGGWAAVSQLVAEGDIKLKCTGELAKSAEMVLVLGKEPVLNGLEAGWLDYSLKGIGPNNQDVRAAVRRAYYPEKPGLQDELLASVVIRYGDLEVFDLPGGGRMMIVSALRIIDPKRKTDLRFGVVTLACLCK